MSEGVLGIRRTALRESVGRGRKEYEASPLTIWSRLTLIRTGGGTLVQ